MTCPTCNQSVPDAYDAAAELARLTALATALGTTPDKVTPALLAEAAKPLGCAWTEVDVAKVASKSAAVKAAVAAVTP